MSEDARWLAVYILTCPHGNILGCFCMPQLYAMNDLQWKAERVAKAFSELFRNCFIMTNGGDGWLFIPKFLKWNRIENPNQGKFAAKAFTGIPNSLTLKALLADDIKKYAKHFPIEDLNSYLNSLETVVENKNNPKPIVIVKPIAIDITPESKIQGEAKLILETPPDWADELAIKWVELKQSEIVGYTGKAKPQAEALRVLLKRGYSIERIKAVMKAIQNDRREGFNYHKNVRSLTKLLDNWQKKNQTWIEAIIAELGL